MNLKESIQLGKEIKLSGYRRELIKTRSEQNTVLLPIAEAFIEPLQDAQPVDSGDFFVVRVTKPSKVESEEWHAIDRYPELTQICDAFDGSLQLGRLFLVITARAW